MAERPPPPTDRDLEAALRDLAPHIAYPATPHLRASLHRRLQERARLEVPTVGALSPRPAPRRAVPRLVAALTAAVILAGSLLAASPGARVALARWLGVPGVIIVQQLPSATPAPLGTNLRLGRRLSLAAARARAPFAILLPATPSLGVPDEVYLRTPPAGGAVTLAYRAHPGLPREATTGLGLLLTEFRGGIQGQTLFGKGLGPGPGAHLDIVDIEGGTGYWITGKPHSFWYTGTDGAYAPETLRLAGNTLLWQRGDVTLRLESNLSKEAALRVAASIR